MSGVEFRERYRVLLVDDQEMTRMVLEKMLPEAEWELFHLADSREVVPLLPQLRPEVILLDLLMPYMDGLELLTRIRQSPGCGDIPVVVLSSQDNVAVKEQAFSLGANDYLVKLPDRVEMVARLRLHARACVAHRRREQVESALQAEEEKYHTLFLQSGEAVFIADAQSGLILDANPAAAQLTGRPLLTLIGLHQSQLHPPGEEERYRALFRHHAAMPAVSRVEAEVWHVEGRAVPVDISVATFTLGGRILVQGVFHDISQRKAREEEVRRLNEALEQRVAERTAELREVNQRLAQEVMERRRAEAEQQVLERQLRHAQKLEAIGTLAGGISHEFNNILGIVIGFAELAMEELPATGESGRYVRQIFNAGLRARDLVAQLLTFSRRSEQGERHPLNPSPILRETLKFLRSTLPASIELKINTDPYPGIINADPAELQQVLMNLCANAAYAMREGGGALEVSLTPVALAEREARSMGLLPGPHVMLGVRDTGTGIPPQVKERIFDPFFSTKEAGEGSGLGLSAVHGILLRHQGGVAVESEPGQGALFRVYFPRLLEPTMDKPAATPLPLNQRGRILLVDDEEALLTAGRGMLARMGYEVVAVADATTAWELFAHQPGSFTAVITDLTMPRMGGEELIARIIALRPGLPLVLCTGGAETPPELETWVVLAKPYQAHELAEALKKALTRGQSPPS